MRGLMKKTLLFFTVLMAACGILGLPVLHVKASNTTGYQMIYSNGRSEMNRVKVGDYYYWIAYGKKSSFKICRAKSKTGKGTTVYKTSGKISAKVDRITHKVSRYDYTGVYTDGKHILFGELDGKSGKVSYWRISSNGKGKKKRITSAVIPYYYPLSGSNLSDSEFIAAYKDFVYYKTPVSHKNSYVVRVYKVSVKTGKKKRVKSLETGGFASYTFDGRYAYSSKLVYDCKTGKKVKAAKKVDGYQAGRNGGVYAVLGLKDGMNVTVYSVKNNTYTVVMEAESNFGVETWGWDVGAITDKYIYVKFENKDEDVAYYRYDIATKELKAVNKADYLK